jgi:hypothetical protein
MNTDIQIVEKPDWVSWEEIKQCLTESHAENRAKGINMAHYQWPAEKIQASIGEKGEMLVALDGNKLVGTAAFMEENRPYWYIRNKYAYVCFDGVITGYSGKGLFRLLDTKREELVKDKGYDMLVFDTHIDNHHRQKIALKNGYKYVRYFMAQSGDHCNVVMAKWLSECPFSNGFIKRRFVLSRITTGFFCTSGRIKNKGWGWVYKKIKRHYKL